MFPLCTFLLLSEPLHSLVASRVIGHTRCHRSTPYGPWYVGYIIYVHIGANVWSLIWVGGRVVEKD